MAGMVQVPFGHTVVNRVMPRMTPDRYKTYGMAMPVSTHWVRATCEQVDCAAYRNGWVTYVDLTTDLGQRQYHYCRNDRSRSFTEARTGPLQIALTYPAGTVCFSAGDHKRRLERPAVFTVSEGDWRGNPRGTDPFTHTSAESWVDDFATHQDRLATEIQKG